MKLKPLEPADFAIWRSGPICSGFTFVFFAMMCLESLNTGRPTPRLFVFFITFLVFLVCSLIVLMRNYRRRRVTKTAAAGSGASARLHKE